jgi:hypothetical protein
MFKSNLLDHSMSSYSYTNLHEGIQTRDSCNYTHRKLYRILIWKFIQMHFVAGSTFITRNVQCIQALSIYESFYFTAHFYRYVRL